MMSLWCVARSPLMMGGDLPRCDEWTLSLLTNPEVLRLTNRSFGARQLYRTEDAAAWTSKDENGAVNLALFNLSDAPKTLDLPAGFSLRDGAALRDLWARKDVPAGTRSFEIPPHGARLLSAK